MRRNLILLAGITSVFYGAGGAHAAEPNSALDASSETGSSSGLEEVIVTAQRRSESLQKVSVAVTAVTGDTLTQRQVVRPEELVFLTPDLKITEAVAPTAKGFAVRGVGTQNFGGVAVAAPVVVDEFVLPAHIGYQALFDVETVQILKGPQGTLFGADSSAGLVNIVTAKPELGVWSGRVNASYQQADSLTDFETTSIQGVVNIPIGSSAAMRLTGYNTERSEMFYNPTLGREVEPSKDTGVRARLLWEPTERFSAELTGAYSEQDDPYHSRPIVSVVPGGYFEQLLAQYGVTPGAANDTVFGETASIGKYSNYYAIARLNWQFDQFTLQSITGYSYNRIKGIIDADDGPLYLLNSAVGATLSGAPYNNSRRFSQEFKVSSVSDQRFTWVAGALFGTSDSLAPGGFPGKLTPALVGTPLFFDFRYNIKIDPQNIAAYGQSSYEISDGWRLITGARVTNQKSTFKYNSFNTPGALPFSFPALDSFEQKYDEWGYAWKLGLEHDLNQDAMVYATVARGYKGPGFSVVTVEEGQDTFVKPEIPMQYELGIKSFLFNRQLRLNAAAFVTDYKDYQAQVVDNTTPAPRILTANAGALKTRGVDLEFEAMPMERLTVSGGVAYIYGKFDDLNNQPCYPGQTEATGCIGGKANGSGEDLPNSPRWTWSLATNYTTPISNSLEMFAGANYYWRSSANFSALGDPATEVASYGLLGATVGIGGQSGNWTLTAYGKNLLDENFPAGLGHLPSLYGAADQLGLSTYRSADAYRQFGIALNVSF